MGKERIFTYIIQKMLTEVNLKLDYANGAFTELVLKKVTQGRICCMPVSPNTSVDILQRGKIVT